MSKFSKIMSKLKGKIKVYDFVGFDVETYDLNGVQTFYFGSIYYYDENGKEQFETYFDKDTLIRRILTPYFASKYIVATNLSFDYTSLFYETSFWNDFNIIYRGSDMILATYSIDKKRKIKFIDTFNYVGFSVEKLGQIIGISKMEKPEYIGKRKSNNQKELNYFIEYNKYDCKISCDFMYFLQKGVNEMGGQLKLTIASTSLDTFRRQYQTFKWIQESLKLKDEKVKSFIQKAYYGGRTEVFKRGKLKNMNYYDINSLYPSQMLKDIPNPNTVFKPDTVSIDNILKYDGVTYCYVITPKNLNYPILPYRSIDKKLIFPLGNFTGYYNNNELRYAISKGYKVIPYKQVLYRHTFKPFNSYITSLYNKRKEFKKQNNNMEIVTKLLMNSLYGKFAQSKRVDTTITDLNNISQKEKVKALLYTEGNIKDNFLIQSNTIEFEGIFTFPIVSSYISSYARILMHRYIEDYNAVYCDTDSIVTDKYIPESKELGEMKLESVLKECEFIKPKMYKMIDTNNKTTIKMKGINKASDQDFINSLDGLTINKVKFTKLRESIRRGFKPNTVIEINKNLSLQDTKRLWVGNESTPLIINEVMKNDN